MLTPLELAWGFPIGADRTAPHLETDPGITPRAAMERVIRRALERPPCLVSFSGGRDSSLVLAVAAHVARRDGLPLPIPVTNRFPRIPESDETSWQELIVWWLRLPEWEILSWDDELDSVGPYAQRAVRLLGVTSPSNQHSLLPIIDRACGGSMLTGMDGDELFELRNRPTATRMFYGPDRRLRDWHGTISNLAPREFRARRALLNPLDYDWIMPGPRREITLRLARWTQAIPLRYDSALLRWMWPSRMTQAARQQIAGLGAANDVLTEHPFSAPEFMSSFAASVGARGPLGRARGLRALAGDLLPNEFLSRISKGSFGAAFNNGHTRAFAETWDGAGFDSELIRAVELRQEWLKIRPDPHSLLLLQSAWLAQSGGGEGALDRRLDVGGGPRASEYEHRHAEKT